MFVFSSGVIDNLVSNPSTAVTLIFKNDNAGATATIELEAFSAEFGSSTPITHQLFTLSPLTSTVRFFGTTGIPGFEVQVAIDITDVLVTGFAKDANFIANAAQRFLFSEMTPIAALTPVP